MRVLRKETAAKTSAESAVKLVDYVKNQMVTRTIEFLR